MTATATPELHYAPSLPFRRRRLFRRSVALGIVVLVAGSSALWLVPLRDELRLLHWQHRCLRHAVPSGTMVYDGDVDPWAPTLRIAVVPKEWAGLYATISPPGFKSWATVFVHEMHNRSGRARLVAVDMPEKVVSQRSMVDYDVMDFAWRVIDAKYPLRRGRVISSGFDSVTFPSADQRVRVYAGSVDATDPSHFTFSYQVDATTYTADGWLREDDSVVIERRATDMPTPPAPASPASLPTSVGSAPGPSARPSGR